MVLLGRFVYSLIYPLIKLTHRPWRCVLRDDLLMSSRNLVLHGKFEEMSQRKTIIFLPYG